MSTTRERLEDLARRLELNKAEQAEDFVLSILYDLDPETQMILVGWFGLEGTSPQTFKQISAQTGIPHGQMKDRKNETISHICRIYEQSQVG